MTEDTTHPTETEAVALRPPTVQYLLSDAIWRIDRDEITLARMSLVKAVDTIDARRAQAEDAAPPPVAGVTIEHILAKATEFVTEQSEGEWGDDLIQRDAEKLTALILSLFSADTGAKS